MTVSDGLKEALGLQPNSFFRCCPIHFVETFYFRCKTEIKALIHSASPVILLHPTLNPWGWMVRACPVLDHSSVWCARTAHPWLGGCCRRTENHRVDSAACWGLWLSPTNARVCFMSEQKSTWFNVLATANSNFTTTHSFPGLNSEETVRIEGSKVTGPDHHALGRDGMQCKFLY